MKARMLDPRQVIHIGVDPATHTNAICVNIPDQQTYGQFVGRIEKVPLLDLWPVLDKMALPLAVAIECPTWSGNGTKEVRNAARMWERLFKEHARRGKLFVYRVDPREWQKHLLNGMVTKNSGTKDASILRAAATLKFIPQDHNVADAACICEWAQMKYREAWLRDQIDSYGRQRARGNTPANLKKHRKATTRASSDE